MFRSDDSKKLDVFNNDKDYQLLMFVSSNFDGNTYSVLRTVYCDDDPDVTVPCRAQPEAHILSHLQQTESFFISIKLRRPVMMSVITKCRELFFVGRL